MEYKYITENNLFEKQTYMYSEYKGIDFIKEYMSSRKNWQCIKNETGGYAERKIHSSVYHDLVGIREELTSGKGTEKAFELVNAYTKSFEVHKKIYTKYDIRWKPLDSADFQEYESYLMFADCLLLAYHHTKCLKYINCLLKLDDTLISVQSKMTQKCKVHLEQIIKQELRIFNKMAIENGISLEVS